MNEHTFVSWLSIDTSKPVQFADLPHLIAHALHPGETEDELMRYGVARINFEEELPKAVQSGELVVRNPAGLGVHSFPHGDALRRSVVLPQDLALFLSLRGIGLRQAAKEPCVEGAPQDADANQATKGHKLLASVTAAPPPPTILRSTSRPNLSIKYEIREPDWKRWQLLDVVRLWEAACLAANIEPPNSEIWATYQLTSLPQAFHGVWEVVNADLELGKLEELPYSGRMLWHVHLVGFVQWALAKGLEIPAPMRAVAARIDGAQVIPDQLSSTPSVSGASERPAQSKPKGITKQQLIIAFQDLKFDAAQWSKYSADPPKWLLPARVQKGTKSVSKHPTLWDPVLVAAALLDQRVPLKKLDTVFVVHKFLRDWASPWADASGVFR